MQIVGGEVGAEVGAVTEDRAVLHEPVVEKDLLPGADVVTREDHPAAGIHDPIGNRRVGLVGAVGEKDQDEEPGDEDESRDLQPGSGDQQLPLAAGRLAPAPGPWFLSPFRRTIQIPRSAQTSARSYAGSGSARKGAVRFRKGF